MTGRQDGICFMDPFSCVEISAAERKAAFETFSRMVCSRMATAAPEALSRAVTGRADADIEEIRLALLAPGKRVKVKSGTYTGKSFLFNGARGNDVLTLIARIEAAADSGTFVAARDRAWFAGLLRSAMNAGVLGAFSAYRNLPILVETGDEGDVVITSPSAGFRFPAHADDVKVMRAAGENGVSPVGWRDFSFPPMES